MPSVSIDNGLMEKVANIAAIRSRFQWSDLGSWTELKNWHPKDRYNNVLLGDVYLKNSYNNMGHGKKKFVALLGVRDLIVVDTGDVLLVAHENRAQDIKQLVDDLSKSNKRKYL